VKCEDVTPFLTEKRLEQFEEPKEKQRRQAMKKFVQYAVAVIGAALDAGSARAGTSC
jgi:hypothetical protein